MNTDHLIETTLPLSPEHQMLMFNDRETLFNVDIGKSPITPQQCLLTLSNMRITASIKDVSVELMQIYMRSKYVVQTTNLHKIFANIITGYKHGKLFYTDVTDDFTLDQYAEFIFENGEALDQWCQVLESIPLYLMMCSDDLISKEAKDNLFAKIKKIDGPLEHVGANLSQLVSLPHFLNLFYVEQDTNEMLTKPYFTHYFDQYICGGEKLIQFLASEEHQSIFALETLGIMKAVSTGQFSKQS
jgi:hypothetical protein